MRLESGDHKPDLAELEIYLRISVFVLSPLEAHQGAIAASTHDPLSSV
jgi:hypothetical protein